VTGERGRPAAFSSDGTDIDPPLVDDWAAASVGAAL
jgi:hypothetical protein